MAPDPRVWAAHKLWLSKRNDREPIKRRRDEAQARAVGSLRVWIAIGPKDWRPVVTSPAIQFVRFGAKVHDKGIQEHMIEGVPVRIYDPAKTVVDLFRYRRSEGRRYQKSPGLNLAIEASEKRCGSARRRRLRSRITQQREGSGARCSLTWRQ
jgi:hypothetical protein